MRPPPAGPPVITRRTLLRTEAILAETVRYRGLGRDATPVVFEPDRQIVVTTSGAFRWHIGRETAFVDANQIAFVRDGEDSRDSSPSVTDVGCLILTPSAALARALWGPPLSPGDPFRRRTALAPNRLQLGFSAFGAALASGGRVGIEPAVAEEWAVELVRRASCAAGADGASPLEAAGRLAVRARELLSAAGELRSLPELGALLSVSPAYLTDTFRRAFGLPIVRYQLKLRLARALAELPHRNDLTALALELGFSSHSHFSTAFRAAMGMTPSRFRGQARTGERPGERS